MTAQQIYDCPPGTPLRLKNPGKYAPPQPEVVRLELIRERVGYVVPFVQVHTGAWFKPRDFQGVAKPNHAR